MMFRKWAMFGLTAALAFTALSCKDDDEKPASQVTFGTETTGLKNAVFVKAGSSDDSRDGGTHYQHSVLLLGDGLTVDGDNIAGKGNVLVLNINSPDKTLTTGTYTYTYEEDNSGWNAFEMRSAYFYVGGTQGGSSDESYALGQATLKVSKSGDKYSFSLTGTAYPEDSWDYGPDTTQPSTSIKADFTGNVRTISAK